MKSFLISVVSLLLISGCASKVLQSENSKIPFVGDFEVTRYRLHNGLKVLVVEDHSSPTFAYQTWFNVGSRDELPGKTGLAHLFEHMMFKQTKNLKEGEFDRLLEEAGAEGENAFTNRDYTAYVQELPSDRLDLIAKLEADRMVNLVVDQNAFKTETEVVQNERRYSYENNPDGVMFQNLFEIAYTQHAYRWPVIGYQQDLDSMTSEDAAAFYKAHYGPSTATIVVVGAVSPRKVLSLIEKYYGHLPANTQITPQKTQEPDQTSVRRKTLNLNIQVEKFFMAYHVPESMHPDAPVLEIIQAILTTGKSSRLKQALVDTGISTSIESGSYQQPSPTLFVFSGEMQKGKTFSQAESVILSHLKRLEKETISDRELEKVKNLIRFQWIDEIGSNSSKARFLGSHETTMGAFEKGLEFQQKVKEVRSEDIQRVVTKYFGSNKRTIIRGVPKK